MLRGVGRNRGSGRGARAGRGWDGGCFAGVPAGGLTSHRRGTVGVAAGRRGWRRWFEDTARGAPLPASRRFRLPWRKLQTTALAAAAVLAVVLWRPWAPERPSHPGEAASRASLDALTRVIAAPGALADSVGGHGRFVAPCRRSCRPNRGNRFEPGYRPQHRRRDLDRRRDDR